MKTVASGYVVCWQDGYTEKLLDNRGDHGTTWECPDDVVFFETLEEAQAVADDIIHTKAWVWWAELLDGGDLLYWGRILTPQEVSAA